MRTMTRRITLMVILGVLVSLAGARAEGLTLASGGKPAVTIVLAAGADPRTATAAKTLQSYAQRICGVELPLQADGKSVGGPAIYIGRCETTQDGDIPSAGGTLESFSVGIRDGNVFLNGCGATVTAFAVYDFVERELGVRWFAPGELWEYVPAGSPGELRVEVRGRTVTPDWSPRIWSGHACTAEWQAWLDRNKAESRSPIQFRQFQNYVFQIFPPDEYAKEHPEYYPLINGKRWIPADNKDRYWRPCESNPDVQRIVIEHARKFLDAHPEQNSFSLGMDDVKQMCGCDSCRAWDASPESYRKREFSDRHYRFVNLIARELRKTHPDKFVGTLCYNIARNLPKTVEKLESNVFITITQRAGDWWRPGERASDMEMTKSWAARCDHMNRYDYIGLGFLTPRVFPHALAEAMRFDKGIGKFHGAYYECYDLLPTTAPMMWMMARLMWETGADADALLGEFYDRMFGGAASTMRAYYDTLEASWNEPRPDRVAMSHWGHRNLRDQAMALSVEALARAEQLVGRALQEAEGERVRQRIEIAGAALRYGSYPIRLLDLSQRLEAASIETTAEAEAVFAAMADMGRQSAECRAFWPEALKRGDIFGDSLRGLEKRGYFVADQLTRLEGGGMALAPAVGILAKQAPEKLDKAIESLGSGNPMAEMAAAARRMGDGSSPNLIRNGSFEAKGTNAAKAERDWSGTGAPPEWTTWVSGGADAAFSRIAGEGRGGSSAVGIVSKARASYNQTISVTAGETYFFEAWGRRDRADSRCDLTLLVRWRDASGGWVKKGTLDRSVSLPAQKGDWHPLVLIAKAPEGAEGASVLLMSQGNGRDRVLVDDVSARKVPQ